ncbi:matrixin family metalloprotease [Candidatus Uhrbacteria bacterium]|nr:matrixin family metalloprotease [Candidatus Uhrbacteria bacterium]
MEKIIMTVTVLFGLIGAAACEETEETCDGEWNGDTDDVGDEGEDGDTDDADADADADTDGVYSFWIDRNCTPLEREAVYQGVDKVNGFFLEKTGKGSWVEVLGEYYPDFRGLTPKRLNDGKNTLICAHEYNWELMEVFSQTDLSGRLGRASSSGDIFIFSDSMPRYGGSACPIPSEWPEDIPLEEGDPCPGNFRTVVMHEIGHMLGLGHVEGDGAVMNAFLDRSLLDFTEADGRHVCERHECL